MLIGALCLGGNLTGILQAATYPMTDDFESGTAGWVFTGTWGLTNLKSNSPGHSLTDSHGGYYANNSDTSATQADDFSLSGATRPALGFYQVLALEDGYDFGMVEISTDGGDNWDTLQEYTGQTSAMAHTQVDLSDYAGQAAVRLRFRLVTDESVVMDGWYIDDVVIDEAPAPVTLTTPTGADIARTRLTLHWSASADPGFAAYVVRRFATTGMAWDDGIDVARIPDAETLTANDIAVSPKTKYYYRVAVEKTNGLSGISNEVHATTLPGMDYPFLDNGEGGHNTWIADSPWALSTELAASGTHAWSDSPGGTYANGLDGLSLTLAAPMNLTSATRPVLSFTQQLELAAGDAAVVEVSTNGGVSWVPLDVFTAADNTTGWEIHRLSLTDYRVASVLVRFRLTTDSADTADGWHLDDISVAESPDAIPPPAASDLTSTGVRLIWEASSHPQVTSYEIYRSNATGVGLGSTRVASVPVGSPLQFIDSGLLTDTDYFYRAYAVTTYGTRSPDSASELVIHTPNNPLPFAEDFEGTLGRWSFGGNTSGNTWGLTTETSHGGNACLTDSPSASYEPGRDTWAEVPLDLSDSQWPVLEFWDRLALGAGDWVRLEIRSTNRSAQYFYGACGPATRDDWQRQRIDLSPWRGESNVHLRFRLVSDGGATPGDGWFLDDISVAENPLRNEVLSVPITEGFENAGLTGWLATAWNQTTATGAMDGTGVVQDNTVPRIAPDSLHALELQQAVSIPENSNVQATFWVRGNLGYYGFLRLNYSLDGGISWNELSEANMDPGYDTQGDWTRHQLSLQGLAGQTIRLRFFISSGYGSTPENHIEIDHFTLAEMPPASNLLTITPGLRNIDLTWQSSTLGEHFSRYELWRSTNPGVSLTNGAKLFETTDIDTATFADTGLNIGATYYYRLLTVDDRGTYIPGNELGATTVPLTTPLTEGFETLDNWLAGSNNSSTPTWAIVTDNPHGGLGCLAAVPTGQYAPGSDTYVETAVDLTNTEWPVLEFWDHLGLGEGDWARLEISAQGRSSQCVTGSCGPALRDAWQKHRIDLSPWRGSSNVRLRFRLATDNGPTPGSGWFIDDLSIAENPLKDDVVTVPILEGFESPGLPGWDATGWNQTTATGAMDGTGVVQDNTVPRIAPDTNLSLIYQHPVAIPADSNVQATFWTRGYLGYYNYLRLVYSTDGGASWSELGGANMDPGYDTQGEWTCHQVSLQGLAGQTIRLRFYISTAYGSAPQDHIEIDRFTLADMPPATDLLAAPPGLRNIDLSWETSTLGAHFARYELWRSTSPGVSLTNGAMLFSTTDIDTTTYADTGLKFGTAYYYRILTVDDRGTYIPGNERGATTVPLTFPLTDGFETLDNWLTGSNNGAAPAWTIVTDNPHGGAGCLAAVPTGQYVPGADTYVETAIDLSDTAWPVLEFWDRLGLGAGDWMRLEISCPERGQQNVYGACGLATRDDWRRHRIDLSPWRGCSNVRLRFRLATDNGPTPGTGWFIDDLSITENPQRATPLTLPFTEGFEDAGLPGWIAAAWNQTSATDAKDGAGVAQDNTVPHIAPDTAHVMELERPVTIPEGSNLQATFWVRGYLGYYNFLRLHFSNDGGISWFELSDANIDYGFDSQGAWTRHQVSLQGLDGQTVRLRFFICASYGSTPEDHIEIDHFALAELQSPVTMLPVDDIQVTSMRVNWLPTDLSSFVSYQIFRGTTPDVSLNSTPIATITNKETPSFTDTGLAARITYYYRIYMLDDRGSYVASDVTSGMTLGIPLPYADNFESATPGWNLTGDWQRLPGAGRNGGTALVDSDGDYQPMSDTSAWFAVDLSNTQWPVLRFWDKHQFAGGSWGRVELSTDGYNWSWLLYGVQGNRTTWAEQHIDLSQWKGQSRVFIRFRSGTDVNLADGWTIDDLSIEEHEDVPITRLFETFDTNPDSAWLAAAWTIVDDPLNPGGKCLRDTSGRNYAPDTGNFLTLGQTIDLTNATDPSLTYMIRGHLDNYSWFRVRVSTDEGVTWNDISSQNLDTGFQSDDWIRQQVSLAPWIGSTLRLRFGTGSSYGFEPASAIFLDNIGIGEPTPLPPVPLNPLNNQVVDRLRPTLTVTNAIDLQSDQLTYEFQVFADADLTEMVSQVPLVASGATTTSWTVDVNLTNLAAYWWRCRASDATSTSEWSAAARFLVTETNNPPTAVTVIAPTVGGTLPDLTEWMVWLTADDADPGDGVMDYQIQIDDDPAFGSPLVNQEGITVSGVPDGAGHLVGLRLATLPGIDGIRAGAWFWRIRARDTHYQYGDWSAPDTYFRMASDYEHWLLASFTAPQLLDPELSGPMVDADHDGIPQMIEYACGMDSAVSSQDGAPALRQADVGGITHLAMEFHRRKGTDVRFHLQCSDTMDQWLDTGATVEWIEDLDPQTEHCRMVDPLPLGAQPQRFLRVMVDLP